MYRLNGLYRVKKASKLFSFSSFAPPPFSGQNLTLNKFRRASEAADRFDLYRILGIGKSASVKQVKDAYYRMAKVFHPDANTQSSVASKKFQEITEAYEILSDTERRVEYDKYGTVSGISSVKSRILSNVMKRSDYVLRNVFKTVAVRQGLTEIDNPDKIFEQEVSVNLSFQEACNGARREVMVPVKSKCDKCQERGLFATINPDTCKVCAGTGIQSIRTEDCELQIACKFCGGSKFQFRVPCPECDGKGHVVKRQKVTFDVPPLVKDGSSMEVPHPIRSNKPLTVRFKVENVDNFGRDGTNVTSKVDIPLTKAILGGKLMVKTFAGYTQVNLPAGVQHGAQITLPMKGIKLREAKLPGDHVITLNIRIPSNLNSRQMQLVQELEELEKPQDRTYRPLKRK